MVVCDVVHGAFWCFFDFVGFRKLFGCCMRCGEAVCDVVFCMRCGVLYAMWCVHATFLVAPEFFETTFLMVVCCMRCDCVRCGGVARSSDYDSLKSSVRL